MFLNMNIKTLHATVRAFFPDAKLENDEDGDGGQILMTDDRSIAFYPVGDDLCDIRACILEDGVITEMADFSDEDEFTEYLKNTSAEG